MSLTWIKSFFTAVTNCNKILMSSQWQNYDKPVVYYDADYLVADKDNRCSVSGGTIPIKRVAIFCSLNAWPQHLQNKQSRWLYQKYWNAVCFCAKWSCSWYHERRRTALTSTRTKIGQCYWSRISSAAAVQKLLMFTTTSFAKRFNRKKQRSLDQQRRTTRGRGDQTYINSSHFLPEASQGHHAYGRKYWRRRFLDGPSVHEANIEWTNYLR